MFRSPFIVTMENFPMASEFTNFITKTIEKELRKYFLEADGYDRINAGDEDVMDYCHITNEELALVNKDAVADLFPESANIFLPDFDLMRYFVEKEIKLKEAQKLFAERINLFLAKKFVQLVKMIKAKELFTPDILLEAMICQIANNAWGSGECKFEGKDKLINAVVEYIAGDDPGSEYAKDVRKSIKNAAYNLRSIFAEEVESEIGWILWDLDYTYILEGDYSTFAALLAFDGSYSEYYMRSIYTSVDEGVPYAIEKALAYKREIEPNRIEIKKAYQEDLMLQAGVLKKDDSGNVERWERYRPEKKD